jgi:8-oxo-dGTP pyrophosphatase MutT (NUDIX family)
LTCDIGPIGSAKIGAAAVIFDERGRVLLVRHTYGRLNWNPPGGIAQPGEEPSAAARRELEEETGLLIPAGSISGIYFEPGHDLGPMLHFVFRFTHDAGQTPVAVPPEIGDVGWFDLDDLPRPHTDFVENRVRDAVGSGCTYRVVTQRTWRE